MSLFQCPACPLWLISSAVNQVRSSLEGLRFSKASSKHFIWNINNQTLCNRSYWHGSTEIFWLLRSTAAIGIFVRQIFVHALSPLVRMKAEMWAVSWVIFNPPLLFFGIITFLLHSSTCLSFWHGNISQLHCFIVSFIYFQIPFHTLLALTRYYTACGECAADWIVTETTTFLVKNKWILFMADYIKWFLLLHFHAFLSSSFLKMTRHVFFKYFIKYVTETCNVTCFISKMSTALGFHVKFSFLTLYRIKAKSLNALSD